MTRNRLTHLLSVALLTVMSGIGYPALAESYPPTDGEIRGFVLLKQRGEVPDQPFMTGEAKELRLEDFKGKVVLLNFWATWCAPCIHEMPGLDRLQAELGSDDFEVVAVNQDFQGRVKAEPFLREKLKLDNLAVYIDPTLRFGRSMSLRGLPTTFLIDRNARIVGAYTGPAEWDSEDAKKLIQHVIDE